jgi:hypothetical protein
MSRTLCLSLFCGLVLTVLAPDTGSIAAPGETLVPPAPVAAHSTVPSELPR